MLASTQFEAAERLAKSEDPDFFYHRGQIKHLTGDIPGAISDFKSALALDKELVYAKIQLGVVEYKGGDVETAMKTFESAEVQFPEKAEVFN